MLTRAHNLQLRTHTHTRGTHTYTQGGRKIKAMIFSSYTIDFLPEVGLITESPRRRQRESNARFFVHPVPNNLQDLN